PNDVWVLESGALRTLDVPGNRWAVVSDNHVWRWNGAGWSRQSSLAYASSLAVIGPSDVWVGATTADYHALSFHWDGASWTSHPSQEIGFVSSLASVASNEVWALVTDNSQRPASM